MNQNEQLARIPIQQPIHNPPQVIQVGDRLYQVNEITPLSQPQPQPIQPYPIQPSPVPQDTTKTLLLLGIVGGCGAGLVAVVMVRAFAPAPIPAAAPAQPQTVIVQPPQPEKRPYSRRDCRADGMFGWNEVCTEERGYE